MATLSRQELYDLVWNQPRNVLAAQLGTSDAALAKLCAKEDVPAPPKGYWAQREAGKQPTKPTLPVRLPGHDPNVVVTPDRLGWRPARGDDPSPPEPYFPERVEDQVADAMKRIDPKAWRQPLSPAHAALRKLLGAEERRRTRHRAHGFSSDRPLFDASHFQRQLKIFIRLAHGLSSVATGCEVTAGDDWVRGKGSHHYLMLTAMFGSVGLLFRFDGAQPASSQGAKATPNVGDLVLVSSSNANDGLRWIDGDEGRLESQLREIAATTLARAEERFRRHAREHRAILVEQIEAARKRDDAAAVERQRVATQKAAAAEQARRDDLTAEAARWHKATQIRAYIAHLDATGPADAEWRAWALRVADEMDPTADRSRK